MKTSRLIDKDPIYLELYYALTHFLSRQHLVIQAVTDQGVDPTQMRRGVTDWYDKTPSRGKWGSEWRFGFHGNGCMLINQHTKEMIDWNGPDPQRVDPYFFIMHLEWRLAQGHDLPLLREFTANHNILEVKRLIDDLIADGIITENYRLIPHLGESRASAA